MLIDYYNNEHYSIIYIISIRSKKNGRIERIDKVEVIKFTG